MGLISLLIMLTTICLYLYLPTAPTNNKINITVLLLMVILSIVIAILDRINKFIKYLKMTIDDISNVVVAMTKDLINANKEEDTDGTNIGE